MRASKLLAVAVTLLAAPRPSAAQLKGGACPTNLPVRATMELLVEPLGLESVTLRLETGRFEPTATPQKFTVHVQDASKEDRVDVLTVSLDIDQDRLVFLGVSGPGLARLPAKGPTDLISRTAAFLQRVNGWEALPDVIPGPTPDRTLRRFISTGPASEGQSLPQTVVFSSKSGIPLVIGVPGPPQY